MALKTAILHIEQKTAEQIREEFPEATDKDVQNIMKLRALMNGQRAFIIATTPLLGESRYELLGFEDRNIDREVWYLLEQDPECGSYIDNREEFNRVYESGDYTAVFSYSFKKEELEWIRSEDK